MATFNGQPNYNGSQRGWAEAIEAGDATPRQYAPQSETELDTLHSETGWYASDHYVCIYHMYTSWGFHFKVAGKLHSKRGWQNDHDAAMAHDSYVIENALKRDLLISEDLDSDGEAVA